MITRIAPTPSGFLHTGNLFSFTLAWLWARSNGGQVLLRIDDADARRKRPEYLDDIFRLLEKLGLNWDIGPTGLDDFERHWSQARRMDIYQSMLSELAHMNRLYACTCSRSERDEQGVKNCNCRIQNFPLNTINAAWKIFADESVPIQDRALGELMVSINSFVVKRRDGLPAYQLCSLADDRHFGVSHVLRGNDLLPSTAMQVFLDHQLELPRFHRSVFWHHPLLTGADGLKLSKSAGNSAQSLLNEIDRGAFFRSFAGWMNWDLERYDGLDSMIGHDELREGREKEKD